MYNYGKTKNQKKTRNEAVQMTMVDFNNKVLNDYLIDMIIWIVGMNGRIYAWNPSKRNIILLEIKKVIVMFVFCTTFDFLDRNGPQLLEYSISKHGDWLIAFFEWNQGKTKCTSFVSKHLWHFLMDVHV